MSIQQKCNRTHNVVVIHGSQAGHIISETSELSSLNNLGKKKRLSKSAGELNCAIYTFLRLGDNEIAAA